MASETTGDRLAVCVWCVGWRTARTIPAGAKSGVARADK